MKSRLELASECLDAENKLINLDFSNPIKAAKRGKELQSKVFSLIK